MRARCTVAIPLYTRPNERLNRVAVESALRHAPADTEILVVDDCSAGDSVSDLMSCHDPRLRVVRNQHNLGLFGNFNRCLELATAPVVRILCSDDRLEPDALERELELLAHHPGAVVLSTQGVRIDDAEHVLGRQADHLPPGYYPGADGVAAVLWFKSHYGLNPLNYPSGVLLRRDIALRAGGFDTTMQMAGDVDLFLRMLRYGDLIITRTIGCRIGVHENQAGAKLARNAAVADEDFALAWRNRDILQQAGVYERVRRQFGGVALGLAQRCWLSGDRAAARCFVATGRMHGVSMPEMLTALGRLVALRCVLRVSGTRRTLLRPSRPVT